jgi:hypothetical protein
MRLRRSQDSFRSRRQELFSGTRGQSYRILRLIRGVWALLGGSGWQVRAKEAACELLEVPAAEHAEFGTASRRSLCSSRTQ